jgi:hypothetical protein
MPSRLTESANEGFEQVEASRQKPYTTVIESTSAIGPKTDTAKTSPIATTEDLESPAGRPLRRLLVGRAKLRQERMEEYRKGLLEDAMYTISVKRQRKLKMKKHKYKKLMKRTRNLRRRLDRN